MTFLKQFVLVIALTVGVGVAHAAEPVIIVFDADEAIAKSKAGKSLQKQLASEAKKLREDADKFRKEQESEAGKLQEQRSLLAADALQAKLQEFQLKGMKKEQELQEELRAIQAGGEVSANDIVKIMGEELKEIAEDRKATIILRREVTAFVDPTLDVTAELVKRIDKRITRVKLKPVRAKKN